MRSSMNKYLQRTLIIGIAATLVVGMTACESGSHASKGATTGATRGAAAGAVGGLVSALVFGGDPIDRAARGAVYGGTTGAVAGGMTGASRDKAERQARENEYDKLREQIGQEAFDGLSALAECRHDEVIRFADKAMLSDNPNHALAGLWLEVLSYADQQDEAKARALFPTLIEKDWEVKNEAEAEAEMRQALNDLMDIRAEYKMPRVCAE